MEPEEDEVLRPKLLHDDGVPSYQRKDLDIQRSLATGKPLQEAWFQNNGRWVKYVDHKELGARILKPISQREIDVSIWEYNQQEFKDLFPDI